MSITEFEPTIEAATDFHPDVAETILDEDALILHSISLDSHVGSNSPLKASASFANKVKVVLALRPDIAASTILPGQGSEAVFDKSTKAGLILKSGKIKAASAADNATVIAPTGERLRPSGELIIPDKEGSLGVSKENVHRAIHERPFGSGSYNELVINSPEVAGIFIAWDSPYVKHNKEYGVFWFDDKLKAELEQLKSLGLPQYVLQNGRLFRIENRQFDESPGNIYHAVGDEVTKEEIVTGAAVISEEIRKDIVQEISDKDLFKATVS